MSQCWFWNIDIDNLEYFKTELSAGRLRQGWGGKGLDLRLIDEKFRNKQPLTENERTTWNHCGLMLKNIQPEDLIAVKNVPSRDKFTIVKVTGGYNFSIDKHDDYGHMLPIQIVKVYHKNAQYVPAPFSSALNRERNSIRITNRHHDTLLALATMASPLNDQEKPEIFKEKIESLRLAMIQPLRDLLKSKVNPTEMEHLILEVLRRDEHEVKWTAGSSEKGADIIVDADMGFGIRSKMAIQVKMHWGEDHDTTGIKQLEQTFDTHGVQAGLLVTTADKLGEGLRKKIEESQKNHNIQVLYGDDLFIRILEMITDTEYEVAE
jgi:predicted Mrr-cat superfamily restriction endonuclease